MPGLRGVNRLFLVPRLDGPSGWLLLVGVVVAGSGRIGCFAMVATRAASDMVMVTLVLVLVMGGVGLLCACFSWKNADRLEGQKSAQAENDGREDRKKPRKNWKVLVV